MFPHSANLSDVVRRVKNDISTDNLAMPASSTLPNSEEAVLPTGMQRGCDVLAGISVGMPIAPMLASPLQSVEQVVCMFPNGAFSEMKYDGDRIQIHN
ncbi:hypothetical protein DQ04_01761130 [Trypanosoma grayi]|uniref:hypothetical protein n=1 Tax=Trypanosoma grayi TaxID=71804 RepID=UPI0004F43B5C|nr:hypothetical protein DQ04_01761130 [Trypanosoma grayi]KEG12378.1 hypothetical protein DQ04_01761130 [Trypanosoma grayi]